MKSLDKGKDLNAQLNIQKAHQHYNGNNNLTISDLNYLKCFFDDHIINQKYDSINHVIFELENAPQVMGSSVGGIMIDFNGALLQVTSNDPDDIPDYTFVNSFSSGGKGFIVLSWIPEHDSTNLIITKQLVDSANTPDSLVMLMFSYIENLYMSPHWWKSLDDKTKRKLVNTFLQGATKDTESDVLSVIPDLKMPKLKSFKTVNYNSNL